MNQLDIKRQEAYTLITKISCQMLGCQYQGRINKLQRMALSLTNLDLQDSTAFKTVIKKMLESANFSLGHSTVASPQKWMIKFKAIVNILEKVYIHVGDMGRKDVCFILYVIEDGKPKNYRKYTLTDHDIQDIKRGDIQAVRVDGEYNQVAAICDDDWTLTDITLI